MEIKKLRWVLGVIVLFVVVIIWILGVSKSENFKPSNAFTVDENPIVKPRKFIVESDPKAMRFSPVDFLEQNPSTFQYKNNAIFLLKKHLTDIKIDATVFEDTMSSIFMSRDSKELIFNVVLYDKKDFFAQKVKVYISGDFINEIPSEISKVSLFDVLQETEGLGTVDPTESSLVPNYYRILNTMYLTDPFLTSGTKLT